MKSSLNQETNQNNNQLETIPIFGYELLRDMLIPGLLGKDTAEISYWAGKYLARKFPLLSIQEIYSFFQEASWGQLRLLEENKREMKFELDGKMVERRIQMNQEPCFKLEAGFVAQQIQSQKRVVSEAHEEIIKRKSKVILTVRWDPKDPTNE